MGNGTLFLPVKAAIRKAIGKQVGQDVWVEIFALQGTESLTKEEIQICLKEEPTAWAAFQLLTKELQNDLYNWINEGKDEDQKEERITKTIKTLPVNKAFWR